MGESVLKKIWNRIANAAKEHSPGVTFNPPASQAEIDQLEEKIGLHLPEDFKESLRIHNGMPVFPSGELLSTEGIYDRWKVWTDLLDEGDFEGVDKLVAKRDGRVKDGCWWCRKWIPIVNDGCGYDECLDCDPGELGVEGQVIRMMRDDDQRPVLAKTFTEWLEHYTSKWEKGEYPFEDGDFDVELEDL